MFERTNYLHCYWNGEHTCEVFQEPDGTLAFVAPWQVAFFPDEQAALPWLDENGFL